MRKYFKLISLLLMTWSFVVHGQNTRITLPIDSSRLESFPPGPFEDNWESIEKNYVVPEWFKDAKFGIFIHWGPYTVAAAGSEWYPKHMYNAMKDYHREHWGAQTKFGYKDFIPLFKAEKFDAEEWARLFKESGAKYVIPTAEHHDGFAMYDSELTEWNAAKMGPCRDIIGELSQAVREQGLKFGVSNHRVENWDFMYPSINPDSTDLFLPEYASFYGPPQKPSENSGMGPTDTIGTHPQNDAFMNEWQLRVMELIDKYQPDLLYFDNGVNYRSMDPWKLKIARYYYNSAFNWGKEVSLQSKSDAYKAGTIKDFERESRAPKEYFDKYWQVDDPIGNKFGYIEGLKIQKAEGIIRSLINNISRNGNLCLNISPRADGTIPDDQKTELLKVGQWLQKYGEAVYGTRGYGKNKDGKVRYTAKGRSTIYAFLPGWNGDTIELPGIKAEEIKELIGLGDLKVSWEDKNGKVYVSLDGEIIEDPASVLKITQKTDKLALFIGDSITDGGWGRSGGSALPSGKRNNSDLNHLLGHSYVLFCSGRMMADNPYLEWKWLNRGISGNTLQNLTKRWREDVLDLEPDILTILIGTNDIWKSVRRGDDDKLDIELWKNQYRNLILSAKDNNPHIKILLISPFVGPGRAVKPEHLQRQRQLIDQYAKAVESLAKETGSIYVDANSLFHSLTDNNSKSTRWIWDGIHPSPAGHQKLADLWLKTARKHKIFQ